MKKSKTKVFLIPGLGYTCRVFERLDFRDFQVRCLIWIEPKQNELFRDYAMRLFKELPQNDENVILIGHSFGGIVAQEIAAVKRIDKIILISSIKSESEMPLVFRFVKRLGLHRYFTKELCIKTVKYWGKTHGFKEMDEQELFKSMISEYSNHYLQWALKALTEWSPGETPQRTTLVHIHGTKDKTFPISLVKNPDIVIEDGSHIMLYRQPHRIETIIHDEIKKTYNKG